MYQQQVTTQVYIPPPFEYDNDLPPDAPDLFSEIFSGRDGEVKKTKRQLNKEASNEKYQEAKTFWLNVRQFGTPKQAAALYWSSYAEYRLDPFRDSASMQSRKATNALEDGKMGRLIAQLATPTFYSLQVHHLGLSKLYAAPGGIFDPLILGVWKEAIANLLPKPYYYRFEVGQNDVLHVHLIANASPQVRYGGKVAQPLYEARGAVAYLYKPILPWSESNLALRLEAERHRTGSRFPRTSGIIGIKNKKGGAE